MVKVGSKPKLEQSTCPKSFRFPVQIPLRLNLFPRHFPELGIEEAKQLMIENP